MDAFRILTNPHKTEKSISLVETENKIVFIVNRKAEKADIKKAFEQLFNVKVEKVTTLITRDGRKKAFVKLHPDYLAADVAAKLEMV
ncbi:50S ribosomal protein L23 [Candidatus Micrarchaeota archaeon RBG_16_49_10]|nr:MAG: 50S ribosomal protein L23 [Candidatus Micrarchaeota archaeon RBG_16_49_10]